MAAAIVAAAMMLSIATPDPTPPPPRWRTSVYARANQITMDGAGNNSFAFAHVDYDVVPQHLNAGATYQISTSKLLEGYLAYGRRGFSVKVGDQFFHSPWADTHLIWGLKPTAFQGVDAKYVAGDWTFEAADMTRFESRDAQSFTRTTLLTNASAKSNGFVYARASYGPANRPYSANAYVYRMSDLDTLAWFTGKATLNSRGWAPYVAAQGGFENNLGASYLGAVHSAVGGAQIGAYVVRNLDVEAAFDVNRGAWLSPYTDGYTSDPWYTSPLLDGMVDRHAAGSSSILDATYTSNDKRFSVLAFDAWYDGVREIDTVVFYRWSKVFLRSGLAQELKPNGNSRHLFLQLEYSSEGKF